MLYGADSFWWIHHQREALGFAGLKVSCDPAVPFREVHLLRNTGGHGFDPDPAAVRTGANSAYQATHIAMHAGAARILLCGVDMTGAYGSHHHGDHPAPLRNTPECAYLEMRRRWPALAKAAAERGIEIINCSAISALECFPKRRIEEVLC